MKIILFFLPVIILLTACSNNISKKENNITAQTGSDITVGITDLSSTKSIFTLLCQDWDYKEDAEEFDNSGAGGDLNMPFRSFSFFADSTVVKNPREDILFGKWIYNDAAKTIDIKYADDKTEKYKIMKIGAKNMTLIKNDDTKNELVFIADGKQEQNYRDDPFYSANNYWRIKPKQAESDEAIKER